MRAAIAILIIATLASPAFAGELDQLATAKSLTDAQRASVKSTVAGFVKQLDADDPIVVAEARRALTSWADQSPTPVFRAEFSKSACTDLHDLVLRSTPLQAVNAVEVLRVVHTPESMQQLARLASSATVVNAGPRLAASRALLASLEARTDMNSAQAEQLVRLIGEAAKRETEWVCSYNQLSALSAIATRPGMDAKVTGAARSVQGEALSELAGRVARDGGTAGQLAKSASRVLAAIRVQYATASASDKAVMAKKLVPALTALQAATASPPEDASEDLRSAYKDASKIASQLSELIASTSPATGPGNKPPRRPAPGK